VPTIDLTVDVANRSVNAGKIIPSYGIHESLRGNRLSGIRLAGWQTRLQIPTQRRRSRGEAEGKAGTRSSGGSAGDGYSPDCEPLDRSSIARLEASLQRLLGRPRSLSFYLDYPLANDKEPFHEKCPL